MNVFVLFETDLHKTKSSRIFLGVFDSEIKAIESAKENDCYRNDCEVLIIETELNKFNEI
jgi:hypothetical protein